MFETSKPFLTNAPEISYLLNPGVVKTFADPGKTFLTFDQFVTIVQWYRDTHYAPDHVEGFAKAVGVDQETIFESPAVAPILSLFMQIARRVNLKSLRTRIRQNLQASGNPSGYTVDQYIALALASAVAVGGV